MSGTIDGIQTLKNFFDRVLRHYFMCETRRSRIRTAISIGQITTLDELKTAIWLQIDRDARKQFVATYRCDTWQPPTT